MIYFIQCSVPSITYLRGDTVYNRPVNLGVCKSIEKSRFAWYPDNTGRAAIQFHGCDTEWVFNNEAERDAEFERILKITVGSGPSVYSMGCFVKNESDSG